MKLQLFVFFCVTGFLGAELNAVDGIQKRNNIVARRAISPGVDDAFVLLNVEATTSPKPVSTTTRPSSSAAPRPATPAPKPSPKPASNPPPKPNNPTSRPPTNTSPPKPANPASKPPSNAPPVSPGKPGPINVPSGKILNSPPPKGTVGDPTGAKCIKPNLPQKKSRNSCSGMPPKRYAVFDELVKSNNTVDNSVETLFKRADQYFFMYDGPQGLYWAQTTSTLYTDQVCGCSVVFIAAKEGAVGIHIPPAAVKSDGNIDRSITAVDFAAAHVDRLLAMKANMHLTNLKAVAFVAAKPPMRPVGQEIERRLRAAGIPTKVTEYNYDEICQTNPSGVGSSVASTEGNMPACAFFNGQGTNFPA